MKGKLFRGIYHFIIYVYCVILSSVLQEVTNAAGERSSSPFRRSRVSFHGGKPSRSPKEAMQVPKLLFLCLSVLTSIVAEDCRYKINSPRPSRPPNALQALTINVAQFLIHANRHDPRVISQIGFAMIPAFSTFHPELHPRLLSFFEENLIRPVLQRLRQMQGVEGIDAIPLDEGKGTSSSPRLEYIKYFANRTNLIIQRM
jgi:hypothetical protein